MDTDVCTVQVGCALLQSKRTEQLNQRAISEGVQRAQNERIIQENENGLSMYGLYNITLISEKIEHRKNW